MPEWYDIEFIDMHGLHSKFSLLLSFAAIATCIFENEGLARDIPLRALGGIKSLISIVSITTECGGRSRRFRVSNACCSLIC